MACYNNSKNTTSKTPSRQTPSLPNPTWKRSGSTAFSIIAFQVQGRDIQGFLNQFIDTKLLHVWQAQIGTDLAEFKSER